MTDFLFVHNHFPGSFGFLAEALLDRGHRCAAIAGEGAPGLAGLPILRWRPGRKVTPGLFPLAHPMEAALINATAALRCALDLRKHGFDPAVIVGHPGRGESLLLNQVFPRARRLAYAPYYRAEGDALGFDPEWTRTPNLEERLRDRAGNAALAMAYAEAERLVCPTEFQRSLLPSALRAQASVIHEGIDTDLVRYAPDAVLRLPNGRVLTKARPVITFIARQLEPLRGFPTFMRALPRLLEAVPQAEILVVGSDGRREAGAKGPRTQTWKERLLSELDGRLDCERIHFVNRLSHDDILAALSVATAHVAYTYPFSLSRVFLKAMACECLVIASDTAPVREVVRDGVNGIVRDFFDADALAETLIHACRMPERMRPLRVAARRTVIERYDRRRHCLPTWLALLTFLADTPARA
ncbi:D-inositol-3-phosphate glycosyltransferase [Methylorubrum aminovorans]|uniref:D-inositol-3-phosphate glycosyltransferase n=1 Tax=Methylorubrum aminovorans TaxID=269069 RepID=A0ABQ4U888_9HYPH|nr:glycosyltransferase [Methylorubrum aminovorans]GJE63006.1 D-inositol-3-phosphate glycosyltransferase [Methylorubrum aminovorans]GMA79022.1 glycosyl transferase [Methylorubrum aminovorans]